MPHPMRSLALSLIGLAAALYWGRVLRMAGKAKRRTGRTANLLPPEPLGRALRVVWTPAILIWVAHPFYAAFAVHPPPLVRSVYQDAAIIWISAAVAFACFFATRACWRRMGSSWRMGIDPDERSPLLAVGAFAYIRHPIYTLSACMMLATMAALPSPLMLLAGAVHLCLLAWEAHREERHLLRLHGAAYAHYRARVGGFWPRSLRPYADPSAPSP